MSDEKDEEQARHQEEAVPTVASPRPLPSISKWCREWWPWLLVLTLLVAVVVVVPIVVTQDNKDSNDDKIPVPVSLVTYYGIEAMIHSRLAQTRITMEVANALDCSSYGQIPLRRIWTKLSWKDCCVPGATPMTVVTTQ
jgi:hypothetical protein